VPYAIAVAFHDRCAGLTQFTAFLIADPSVLGLAAKITYRLGPNND